MIIIVDYTHSNKSHFRIVLLYIPTIIYPIITSTSSTKWTQVPKWNISVSIYLADFLKMGWVMRMKINKLDLLSGYD